MPSPDNVYFSSVYVEKQSRLKPIKGPVIGDPAGRGGPILKRQ
jgi:hypothetical protein